MASLFPRSVFFAAALAVANFSSAVADLSLASSAEPHLHSESGLAHLLDHGKIHSLVQDQTFKTFLRSAKDRHRHDIFEREKPASGDHEAASRQPPLERRQQPGEGGKGEEGPTIAPEERRKIKEEIRRDVEKDLERDLDDKIEKELEKDEEKIEENVEEEIEEEIKKDLAEEGIGKEERVSPIGERVLQDLDDKWTLFKWGMVIFLMTTVCIFCLCYSQEVIEDSGLSCLPQEVINPPVNEDAEGRLPYGVKTMTVLTCIFMPLGLAFRLLHFPTMWIFLMNLLAIVPEAFLLGVATEELALHMGDAVGAMLNASFGNACELIFVYFTLKDNLIDACVGSLLGSILSNHLVLLGAAFLVGGMLTRVPLKLRLNQGTDFDASSAIDQAQQLLMASFAITLPALFADMHYVTPQHVMALSLAFSCFLMLSYVALVFHQLVKVKHHNATAMQALLSPKQALFVLGISTLLLSVSSECMVHALDDFCHMMGLSQTFVGVVLLPLAGDISHWSAVYMAMRNKMDLAINIAMASAVQIALVIVPLAVFMGYAMDRHMTLSLGSMQGVVLNISAVITFAVLVDGKSNWLRGVTLITTFMFITVMIFFTPDVVAE